MTGIGTAHLAITSRVPMAQRFFDQGLNLLHAFWDTEAYVLPVLTYTAPDAAADALRWRLSILDLARERAAQLHLSGAAFPWRTIAGRECSGYWPAGTAAMHANAVIAAVTAAPAASAWSNAATRVHGIAGFGRRATVASVMIASVPSDPTSSWSMS